MSRYYAMLFVVHAAMLFHIAPLFSFMRFSERYAILHIIAEPPPLVCFSSCRRFRYSVRYEKPLLYFRVIFAQSAMPHVT